MNNTKSPDNGLLNLINARLLKQPCIHGLTDVANQVWIIG